MLEAGSFGLVQKMTILLPRGSSGAFGLDLVLIADEIWYWSLGHAARMN